MINKNNLKCNCLIVCIFLVGLLSVSIANFLGGHYGPVAAIVVILSTMLVFEVLNNNLWNENKRNLLLIAILTTFEIVFFVVNDIIDYSVYEKGNIDFIGGLVIGSQLYSAITIVYYLFEIVFSMYKKDRIELVDDHKTEELDEIGKNVDFETSNLNDEVEEIKSIPLTDLRETAPFMEEEK